MKPILCRPGGKKLLVNRLLKEIPPHKTYVEPFVGGGALFFAKELANKNVLNDNDCELIKFYKEAQKKKDLTCKFPKPSERTWLNAKSHQTKSPCDYIYATKHSYGCMSNRFHNNKNSVGTRIYNEQKEKLRKAQISCSDFKSLIKKHDSKDVFFYLDPPYHEKSCSYPKGSCNVSPNDVAESVKGIKGKFLLSYNNHPDVRKLFCDKYKCKTVQTKYSVNVTKDTKQENRKELIIKNY